MFAFKSQKQQVVPSGGDSDMSGSSDLGWMSDSPMYGSGPAEEGAETPTLDAAMSTIASATGDVLRSLTDAGAGGSGVVGTIERIRLGLGEAMYTGEEGDLHHEMGALTESVGASVEQTAPEAGEEMTAAVVGVVDEILGHAKSSAVDPLADAVRDLGTTLASFAAVQGVKGNQQDEEILEPERERGGRPDDPDDDADAEPADAGAGGGGSDPGGGGGGGGGAGVPKGGDGGGEPTGGAGREAQRDEDAAMGGDSAEMGGMGGFMGARGAGGGGGGGFAMTKGMQLPSFLGGGYFGYDPDMAAWEAENGGGQGEEGGGKGGKDGVGKGGKGAKGDGPPAGGAGDEGGGGEPFGSGGPGLDHIESESGGGGGGGGGGGQGMGSTPAGAAAPPPPPTAPAVPAGPPGTKAEAVSLPARSADDTLRTYGALSASKQAASWPGMTAAVPASVSQENDTFKGSLPGESVAIGAPGGQPTNATVAAPSTGDPGVTRGAVDPGALNQPDIYYDKNGQEVPKVPRDAVNATLGGPENPFVAWMRSLGMPVPAAGPNPESMAQTADMQVMVVDLMAITNMITIQQTDGSDRITGLAMAESTPMVPLAGAAVPSPDGIPDMSIYSGMNLTNEARTAFDADVTPVMAKHADVAALDSAGALDGWREDRATHVNQTHEEIEVERRVAEVEQEEELAAQRGEVANLQKQASAESAAAADDARGQVASEQMAAHGDIQNKSRSDQARIKGEYDWAAGESTREIARGEKEVEGQVSEKQKLIDKAPPKDDPGYPWYMAFVVGLGGGLIEFGEMLKKAITQIFDGIRYLVNTIIEGVKKLADAILDGLHKFADMIIDGFAAIAHAIVDGLLAGAFPELAASLNEAIDGLAAAAHEFIGAVFEALKKFIHTALDQLGKLLDTALDFLEAGIELMFTFLQSATTGDWSHFALGAVKAAMKLMNLPPEGWVEGGVTEDGLPIPGPGDMPEGTEVTQKVAVKLADAKGKGGTPREPEVVSLVPLPLEAPPGTIALDRLPVSASPEEAVAEDYANRTPTMQAMTWDGYPGELQLAAADGLQQYSASLPTVSGPVSPGIGPMQDEVAGDPGVPSFAAQFDGGSVDPAAKARDGQVIPSPEGAIDLALDQIPAVPLTGDADPARMAAVGGEKMEEIQVRHTAARDALIAMQTQGDIQPLAVDADFTPGPFEAPMVESGPEIPGLASFRDADFPEEATQPFDTMYGPEFKADQEAPRAKLARARMERDVQTDRTVFDAKGQADGAVLDTRTEQDLAIDGHKTMMADVKATALADQNALVDEARTEVETEHSSSIKSISEQVETGQEQVDDHLTNAEAEAGEEVLAGQRLAMAEFKAAEDRATQVHSWAEWDEFSKTIAGLMKKAVTGIFDRVKAAAHAIVDAAKDLVNGLIDAVVALVQKLIDVFANFLCAIIGWLFGDAYPELAADLQLAIHEAADSLKHGMQVLGDKLKETLSEIWDFLHAAVDIIIGQFQSLVEGLMAVIALAITGDWKTFLVDMLCAALTKVGIDPSAFRPIFAGLMNHLEAFFKDPGKFLKTAIEGLSGGFGQFFDNFPKHALNGLSDWITGGMEADIDVPKSLDGPGAFVFICEILGLDLGGILHKIAEEVTGEKEGSDEHDAFYEKLAPIEKGGWDVAFAEFGSEIGDMKPQLISAVMDVVLGSIIAVAAVRMASMFNPLGALGNVILMMWDIYSFIRENTARIAGVMKAWVDSIGEMAAGNSASCANKIEGALADSIPLTLDLVMKILHLDDITDNIKTTLAQTFPSVIEMAIRMGVSLTYGVDIEINTIVLPEFEFGGDDDGDGKKKKDDGDDGKPKPHEIGPPYVMDNRDADGFGQKVKSNTPFTKDQVKDFYGHEDGADAAAKARDDAAKAKDAENNPPEADPGDQNQSQVPVEGGEEGSREGVTTKRPDGETTDRGGPDDGTTKHDDGNDVLDHIDGQVDRHAGGEGPVNGIDNDPSFGTTKPGDGNDVLNHIDGQVDRHAGGEGPVNGIDNDPSFGTTKPGDLVPGNAVDGDVARTRQDAVQESPVTDATKPLQSAQDPAEPITAKGVHDFGALKMDGEEHHLSVANGRLILCSDCAVMVPVMDRVLAELKKQNRESDGLLIAEMTLLKEQAKRVQAEIASGSTRGDLAERTEVIARKLSDLGRREAVSCLSCMADHFKARPAAEQTAQPRQRPDGPAPARDLAQPLPLNDGDISSVKRNESQSINETQVLKTHEPVDPASGSTTAFFKAPTFVPGVGNYSGIPNRDPRLPARAVASSRMDQALGINVLSREYFAEVGGAKGNASAGVDGKALWKNKFERESKTTKFDYDHSDPETQGSFEVRDGVVYDKSSTEVTNISLKKPATQKGFADLQLIDYLTNQVDRHYGNVFVDSAGNVKGIDNDLSFGTETFGTDHTPNIGQNLGLPSHIDANTAAAVSAMTDQDFIQILKGNDTDHSKLSPQEINAAVARLHALQDHIQAKRENNELVDQWDDRTHAASLQGPDNYLSRFSTVIGQAKNNEGGMELAGRAGAAGGALSLAGAADGSWVRPPPNRRAEPDAAPAAAHAPAAAAAQAPAGGHVDAPAAQAGEAPAAAAAAPAAAAPAAAAPAAAAPGRRFPSSYPAPQRPADARGFAPEVAQGGGGGGGAPSPRSVAPPATQDRRSKFPAYPPPRDLVGNAAAVTEGGSQFHGRHEGEGRATPADVDAAIAKLGPAKEPGHVALKDQSGRAFEAKVVLVDPAQIENGAVAQYEITNGEVVIKVSKGARADDVQRAMVHEAAELRHLELGVAGAANPKASAFAAGAGSDAPISAHDHGRLAELAHVADDGYAARDQDRRAKEVAGLVEHMGLSTRLEGGGERLERAKRELSAAGVAPRVIARIEAVANGRKLPTVPVRDAPAPPVAGPAAGAFGDAARKMGDRPGLRPPDRAAPTRPDAAQPGRPRSNADAPPVERGGPELPDRPLDRPNRPGKGDVTATLAVMRKMVDAVTDVKAGVDDARYAPKKGLPPDLRRALGELMYSLDPADPGTKDLFVAVNAHKEATMEGKAAAGHFTAVLKALDAVGKGYAEQVNKLDSHIQREAARDKGFTADKARLLEEGGEGGNLKTAYKVEYTPKDGEPIRGRWFDDAESATFDNAPPGDVAGIPASGGRLAHRAVASKLVDDVLRTGLLPVTEFGTLMMGKPGEREEKVGLFLAEAVGDPAGQKLYEADEDGNKVQENGKDKLVDQLIDQSLDFADPTLQRALANLQILDAITGQTDRHIGNYYVRKDGQGNIVGVTGIDNDLAFGVKVDMMGKQPKGSKNEGLPPYIDATLGEKILGTDFDAFRDVLAEHMTPAELSQAEKRYGQVKSHVQKLRAENKFVDEDGWNDRAAAEQRLKEGGTYASRDADLKAHQAANPPKGVK